MFRLLKKKHCQWNEIHLKKTYDELKIPDPTLKKKTLITDLPGPTRVVFCQMSKPSVFVWPLWLNSFRDGIQLSSQIFGGCPLKKTLRNGPHKVPFRFHEINQPFTPWWAIGSRIPTTRIYPEPPLRSIWASAEFTTSPGAKPRTKWSEIITVYL